MADAALDKLLRSERGTYSTAGASVDGRSSKASTAESQSWPLPGAALWLAAWGRSLMVLWASGLSAGLALVGLGVLAYLLLTCALTPPVSHVVRPIYFDYTRPGGAVGVASLLKSDPYQLGTAVQGKVKAPTKVERFLSPGQQVDVWLQLEVVDTHDQTDVFQVVGELLTSHGHVIAAFSRPCLTPRRSLPVRAFRAVVLGPLRLLGLVNDNLEMWVPLFHNYREREDAPFTVFRARLIARAGTVNVPPVYTAAVHVKLRMTLFKRLLYMLRPGSLVLWSMAFAAVATVTGAGTAAVLFFYIWLYHATRSGGSGGKAGKGAAFDGSTTDVDDDALSEESSLSDVASDVSDSDDDSPLSGAGPSADSLAEAEESSVHGMSPVPSLLTDRSHHSDSSERTLPYAPCTSDHGGEAGHGGTSRRQPQNLRRRSSLR